MLYAVNLFKLGLRVGKSLLVEAPNARQAMDEVEVRLGLRPPTVAIDLGTGKLSVARWHGYEFRARPIGKETLR